MKQISILLLLVFSYSSTSAGLFEYVQGESTRINTTSYESSDVIEAIYIPSAQYTTKNRSSHTNTFRNDMYHDSHQSSSADTQSITDEMNYYLSISAEIRRDITKIRNYGGDYILLKKQLEQDLDDIQNHINFLSGLRSEITFSHRNYSNNSYNYYNNFRSQKLVNYYAKYGYDYDVYAQSYYQYSSHNGYYQKKTAVSNRNKKTENTGYIYIK